MVGMAIYKIGNCLRTLSISSMAVVFRPKSKKIMKLLAIITWLFCTAVIIGACYQEQTIDIQLDDTAEITIAATPESSQTETSCYYDGGSAEITIDAVSESSQATFFSIHGNVDDPIIPLAYYDEEKGQLVRYNWNIEIGEITRATQIIMYTDSIIFTFRWDGGSYILVEDWGHQFEEGPGIRLVIKESSIPVYQDFIADFSRHNGLLYIRPVNLESFIISNDRQQYQFDFTNISIPGGFEEAYIVASFYFENDTAYFLLYPLLNNAVEKKLAVINYDMKHNDYKVSMVANSPEFLGAEPPVGNWVSSSGNKFLICNFLDGLYEIDSDTCTAQKLYDNNDFALKDNLDYWRIAIESASYYNGYLLLTVNHYLISEEIDSTSFVVIKDGAVVAMMNTTEMFFMPNM